MNREEAIRRIQDIERCTPIHTREDARDFEALEMAIKALDQKPCGDAIDRAEAIKIASGYCHPANVAKELAKLPAVNPQEPTDTWSIKDVADALEKHGLIGEQEPKTGHWIIDKDDRRKWDRYRFYCSECGKWQTYGKTKYCLHCGAKMVEPQERSDKE